MNTEHARQIKTRRGSELPIQSYIFESSFDLAKCGFWSGEAIPGVRRPVNIQHSCLWLHSLQLITYHITATWPTLRTLHFVSNNEDRTGDNEIGWHPAPEKILRRCPAGAKMALGNEKCLMNLNLGSDTRTSTQSRRLASCSVRRKGASWILNS